MLNLALFAVCAALLALVLSFILLGGGATSELIQHDIGISASFVGWSIGILIAALVGVRILRIVLAGRGQPYSQPHPGQHWGGQP